MRLQVVATIKTIFWHNLHDRLHALIRFRNVGIRRRPDHPSTPKNASMATTS
jgi:hypothetical protein